MKDKNIIILAQQSWDTTIGTNPRNMARELAKHNRVLYINMALDLRTVWHRRREAGFREHLRAVLGQPPGVIEAEPSIWVFTPDVVLLSVNWLPSRALFEPLNRLNATWLARSIRRAARAASFDSYYLLEDGLLLPGLELKRLLKPRQFIYNLRDNVLTVPYFQRHGPWLEAALMRQADIVTANSEWLRDYAQRHNPRSYDIGQGCVLNDYQADAIYSRPSDLPAGSESLIVYTGFLTALRLDIDLLETIARQRPAWHLVLLGPEDEEFERSALHRLPNVFFLGRKAPQELAAYLHHCDACINPQLVNDITIGNYPLKIDEYLAMGKPVVATDTPAMSLFAGYVHLARDPADWLQKLEVALSDHDPAARTARILFAQSHSWAASMQKLSAAVAAQEGARSNL